MANLTPAITWFKTQFGPRLEAGLAGTPFSPDLLTAVALQETSYIWAKLIDKLSPEEILEVCVGDTLDAPNRSAFPKTKDELVAAERGEEMFQVAREALEAVGAHDDTYRKLAQKNPNKFCHGFGIFQYDIQFFKDDPDFFLDRQWRDFDECLKRSVRELTAAMRRAYKTNKPALTDNEMVYTAIAYNCGHVNVNGDFKQGFKSDDGRCYGENIADYLQKAKAVAV